MFTLFLLLAITYYSIRLLPSLVWLSETISVISAAVQANKEKAPK